MEKIICPICKSIEIKLAFKKGSYDLYSCVHCQLLFVWPTPRDLKNIYSSEYFNNQGVKHNFGYVSYDQDKLAMAETFEKYLDKIERSVSGRNIFDVGAATGYFLDLAKARGWQTFGVDISDYAAQEASQRGHQVVAAADISNLGLGDKFSAVTMWDVMEHLPNPVAYLSQLNRIMETGAVLAANTINKSSWWAKLLGRRWHAIIPPEHLFFYSSQSLNKLFSRTGFEVLEIKVIGKKFSLAYVFNILHHWLKFGFFEKLAIHFNRGFFRKLSLYINLRDNIFIMAKKVKNV
ncbi:MAG: hypothetical protein C3F02_00345 [Parcubacteria group bacterium]|nr:MAG: hypothetical protein C3F02_00345 [Parcubacteria group bacterium]